MRLPAGTRDWLPAELSRKRELEAVLRGAFERWGYNEVQTPSFEELDVLEMGLGDELASKTFRLGDDRGAQLALRPEMTTPVARLVSTRLRELPLPLRVSYVQPVFRYEEPQEGRLREFTQAGLELIGPANAAADAESLLTAIEALDAAGFGDARFDLNHVGVIEGVLVSLGLDDGARRRCKTHIAGRNIVALRELLGSRVSGSQRDALVALVMLRGREEVLERAEAFGPSASGRAAIERLRHVLQRADQSEAGSRLAIDLSLLRDAEYYNGLVFEGFVADAGFALCGGGRYDSLLPRFGLDAGAVGWSVNVERLLIALERRGHRR